MANALKEWRLVNNSVGLFDLYERIMIPDEHHAPPSLVLRVDVKGSFLVWFFRCFFLFCCRCQFLPFFASMFYVLCVYIHLGLSGFEIFLVLCVLFVCFVFVIARYVCMYVCLESTHACFIPDSSEVVSQILEPVYDDMQELTDKLSAGSSKVAVDEQSARNKVQFLGYFC